MKLLNEIQQKLKAPKNQVNKFGGYNYRSCEDILEAVKPLLGNGTLILEDEMIQIGERFYVKATARLFEAGKETAHASAYARESLEKKGMDTAQITGAASSYARKYALNGLFLIDDTKDADGQDNTEKRETMKPYRVEKKYENPEMDETNDATPLSEEQHTQDEVEDMLKDGIKSCLTAMGKKTSKSIVKELTGMDMVPKNYDAVYKKLKVMQEATDPLRDLGKDV